MKDPGIHTWHGKRQSVCRMSRQSAQGEAESTTRWACLDKVQATLSARAKYFPRTTHEKSTVKQVSWLQWAFAAVQRWSIGRPKRSRKFQDNCPALYSLAMILRMHFRTSFGWICDCAVFFFFFSSPYQSRLLSAIRAPRNWWGNHADTLPCARNPTYRDCVFPPSGGFYSNIKSRYSISQKRGSRKNKKWWSDKQDEWLSSTRL